MPTPPIPRRRPAGLANVVAGSTAWASLDPHSRQIFLAELLAMRPGLQPAGAVDYDSELEPLLENTATGEIVQLDGTLVFTGEGALFVPVTQGAFLDPKTPWLWIIGGLLLLALLAGGKPANAA